MKELLAILVLKNVITLKEAETLEFRLRYGEILSTMSMGTAVEVIEKILKSDETEQSAITNN